jgi:hypothetical protein
MEQADFKQALAQFRERIENDKVHGMNHDMIEHDNLCHEGNNTLICYDSCHESNQLDKSEWWYLVNTLTEWRVYNARSVVKRNPRLAWKVMNLCKDKRVRVKGAYFTTCFRRELAKLA